MQRTAAERTKSSSAQELSTQRHYTAPMAPQQDSMDVDEDNPLQAIGQMSLNTREDLIKSQGPNTTVAETQGSTQTKEDRATRVRLAKMVCDWHRPSSSTTRILIPAQMIPSPQAQNTEETQIVISPAPHFNPMDFLSQMPRFQLSEAKVKDLERRKSPMNTRGRPKRGKDSSDGDTISCECGNADEENDMVSQASNYAQRT